MNLSLLANRMNFLGMGGQVWVHQFTNGFPKVGTLSGPGVFPIGTTASPDLIPQHRMAYSKWGINTRRAAVADPRGGVLCGNPLNAGDRRWLRGPFPYDDEGRLVTRLGLQLANPAVRFGVQREGEFIAADDLKRSETKRAAAIQTQGNLPTWDHFEAISSLFQESWASECLATATADQRGAHKHQPVLEEREMLSVATQQDPKSGKTRGFVPRTQPRRPTAAAFITMLFQKPWQRCQSAVLQTHVLDISAMSG